MSIFDNGLEGEYYVHNWGWMVKALKDNIAKTGDLETAWNEFRQEYIDLIPPLVIQQIDKAIADGVFTAKIQEIIDNFPVLSIKDFGAVGDGKHDDTAAFLSAINENDIVLFPKGIYIINAPTFGESEENRVFHKKLIGVNPLTTQIIVHSNYLFFSQCSDITLKNIQFSTDNPTQITTPVGFWKHHGLIIDNCIFNGGKNFALQCANTDEVRITNSIFQGSKENSALNFSTDANLVHGEFSQKPIYIENCEFTNGGLDGVIANNDNFTFMNCYAHENGTHNQAAGYYSNNMINHRYISCRSEHNTGNGFDFVSVKNFVVDSCVAYDNDSAGIFAGQSEFIRIVNSYATENGNQPVEEAQDSGIAFKQVSNASIINNSLFDRRVNPFQTFGIRMSTGCQNIYTGLNTTAPNKSGSIYSKSAYNAIKTDAVQAN